jgi:O-antigen/teichoic acid export membrane protein
VGISIASFAVCGVATWLFRVPITEWLIGDVAYRNVLVAAFAANAVAGVKGYYFTYLRNMEQAGTHTAYTIGERLLSAVLSVILIAWAGFGIIGLVLGQMLATLTAVVGVGIKVSRFNPLGFDRALLADALRLGLPLMPRVLFVVVSNNFDKYLIGRVESLGGVGIYSIGQRVANIAFTYMTALQNVFGPQVYSRMFSGDPDAGRSIGRYLTPFAFASTIVSFLIAVFSEEILSVLAPESYRGAEAVAAILVLFYAIQFFAKMPQITYARKTYLLSVLALTSACVNVAMGVLGIYLLGTIGAAWGALAAGLVMVTITFLVGQRYFRIEWEYRKMTAIFGLLFVSAFVTIAMRSAGAPYAALLAAKLVAVAAFGWLGMRLRILTVANLLLVRDLVRARLTPATAPRGTP